MRAPTMLPTMRYDPDREVVLIQPQDGSQPYVVTRTAIESRVRRRRRLSLDDLINVCEEHEGYFTIIATCKLFRSEVDADGHAVIMAYDVMAIPDE